MSSFSKFSRNVQAGVSKFYNDEEAASAVEYGLLAALIAVVIIAGAKALGTNTNATFQKAAASIKT